MKSLPVFNFLCPDCRSKVSDKKEKKKKKKRKEKCVGKMHRCGIFV